ncbi:MAG TPA: glycosyltransferase [Pirellulales bacterium]|jgi:glycosyltransferase involved in cell wall biosynthesis|nr:glycosyltransferase [Pirellulales bacterium]
MKILFCHNYYQQPGGEDRVFADETALMESRGHEVLTYTIHNDSIRERSKLALACGTLWNRRIARELRARVERERVELVHFHNTFPLISPAAYYAVRQAGAAVVQTLHNFRLLCPQATFLRNAQVCTECLGRRVPWPAIRHACYRDDRLATATLTASLTLHRLLNTYRRSVDQYISLTEFARSLFIRGGLPAEKLAVKPNFVYESPAVGRGEGGFALFVGRLSVEKGVLPLLAAWELLGDAIPLRIIGDGPLAEQVRQAAARQPAIQWHGSQTAAEVQRAMQMAACLILPSTWYEGLPKTLVEAFSVGTPVIGSRLGAMEELIEPDRTGALFAPDDAAQLADVVRQFWDDPAAQLRLRQGARAEYEFRYSAERNYELLTEIYQQALVRRWPERAAHLEPLACGEVS